MKAVLFDLDGTLLDTLADIGDATNEVLRQHGFSPHPLDAYRQFVGDGVEMLIRRALAAHHPTEEAVAACLETLREVYPRHWNVKTRAYPGIQELLEELRRRGLKLAILSNKPDALTQKCAGAFFPEATFEAVIGQRADLPRKPNPAGAMEAAKRLGVPPSEFLYIGDTNTDMRTAQAAQMFGVGALWGFRTKEELVAAGAQAVIERPLELLKILDRADP